jgi:hypothetical protein
MGQLRDVQLRNWIRSGKAIAMSDGDGLTFTLSERGTASWVLRYRLNGKQRELTLGRYPDLTLEAARKLATKKRVEVQQGIDVAREKQKSKQDAVRAWTFKHLADDYLERASERLADRTVDGRRQQLRDYVIGRIGQHHRHAHRVGRFEKLHLVTNRPVIRLGSDSVLFYDFVHYCRIHG